MLLSGSTALIGGVLGAVLSYLIVSLGAAQRAPAATLSVAGVLAQFGGVTLAFAWIALLGFSGLLTEALRHLAGIDIFGSGWLFGLQRADRGLHLLPDPAHGHRLHPGARGPPPAVARGGGQPRRDALAVLAAWSASRC